MIDGISPTSAARIFGKQTYEVFESFEIETDKIEDETDRSPINGSLHDASEIEPEKQAEDDVGTGFLIFFLCGCSAMEGADAVLLPATFYALQSSLHVSLSDLSTMTLVEAMAMSAIAPVWGMIADRRMMTRTKILMSGALLQGAILILISFMNSFYVMLFLRLLNGAMLAMLRPVASGIIGDAFPEKDRGKAFGKITGSMNLGMCISALLCTPLSTQRILGINGWRFAYALVGSVSVVVGILVACFMVEPVREELVEKEQAQGGAAQQEIRKLLRYFRMHTFKVLVMQGVFGCIPWNALNYQTLFYQIEGLGDMHASALQAFSQLSNAVGVLFGGFLGDRLSVASPNHGRPCLALISVSAGIPFVFLIFMVPPPEFHAFPYYAALVVCLGLTASWCGAGVNWPIMTQIVEPNSRSSIMAWQAALEGSSSAILGNAAVGFLAEKVFGYNMENAQAGNMDRASIRALGRALALTCVVPWGLCLVTFSFLHWSYPRDLVKVRAMRVSTSEEGQER